MTAKDILLYQVGNRGAIERVAASPATFITGLLLVLITGIPRNYDQIYFLETWRWLYGPLAFSLVSGTWMYWAAKVETVEPQERPSSWFGFMGLFWMTAPLAWIYALPVERALDVKEAAMANLALLGVVSACRVLLLSRVLSVVQGTPFLQSLSRVLFVASAEAWLATLFGRHFSQGLIIGMAGMRNAPEEDLIIRIVAGMFMLGWLAPALLYVVRESICWPDTQIRAIRSPGVGRPLAVPIGVALGCWVLAAIPPQLEQRRFYQYDQLTRMEGYGAALKYLATLQPGDLPPQRRLRPSPYEYEAWMEYPKCFAAMDGAEPAWVAQTFRQGLEALMLNWRPRSPETVVLCLEAIARIDHDTRWIRARRTNVVRALRALPLDGGETNGAPSFRERLEAIGIVMEEPKPSKPAGPSKPQPSPAASL